MEYIESTLLADEKIIYTTTPHWIIFLPSVVILVLAFLFYFVGFSLETLIILGFPLYKLALLIVLLYSIIAFIKAWIIYHSSEYGITDKRVIMKTGWLKQYSLEIFLDKIEAVFVRQNIAGRIFNYGNIIIVGTGGTQDIFFMLFDPFTFRKSVEQQIDLYKRTRA